MKIEIKELKCPKCGWVDHECYPLAEKVMCRSCYDIRRISPFRLVEAENITHGGSEKRV